MEKLETNQQTCLLQITRFCTECDSEFILCKELICTCVSNKNHYIYKIVVVVEEDYIKEEHDCPCYCQWHCKCDGKINNCNIENIIGTCKCIQCFVGNSYSKCTTKEVKTIECLKSQNKCFVQLQKHCVRHKHEWFMQYEILCQCKDAHQIYNFNLYHNFENQSCCCVCDCNECACFCSSCLPR
jgi:hypothetical protein